MGKFCGFIFSFLVFLSHFVCAQQEVDLITDWKYYKGIDQPILENALWYAVDYDDSNWETGSLPFRYGDGEGGTVLEDMEGSYSSFFLRKTFTDTFNVEQISFIYDFDDGFILYFNGTPIISKNAPQNPKFNSQATGLREFGESEKTTFVNSLDIEYKETNVLAVQVFNKGLSSSDIYFDLKIYTTLPLPVAEKPLVDVSGGIYEQAFTATIYPRYLGDTVYYTLDATDPATSSDAVMCVGKTEVLIDPNNTVKRGKTPAVVLSVKTIRSGFKPSPLLTNTYLFLSEVKNQKYPGWKWPTNPVNNQVFDYEMDDEIMNDPRYRDSIDIALGALPSLMLTVDMDDLFDSKHGIYVNAFNKGYLWERAGSLELIDTNGEQKFTVGIGVRIRGGSSRQPINPKHAFRLFFRSEYGNSKLKYPMFEDEGAKKFDKLDLRTAQNYSWSFKGDPLNTMNRDVFSRDTQRDMGKPYTRSRYYHLYVNGLYFGIYQTEERPEANYAETYFGGKSDDYDVVKVAREENKTIEATDGNLEAWEQVYALTEAGFDNMQNYYRLLGKNQSGERDTSLPVLVDVDNLIDYMLVIFAMGNYDAPVSQFFKNNQPNNFYAIYDRADKSEGFRFLVHDSEHTLRDVNQNRVNISHISVNPMLKPPFEFFHPQWLHYTLTANKEYVARFADRAYQLLYNEGALGGVKNRERFMQSANSIQEAIIAESARWGDAKKTNALNKQDHWIPAISYIANDYFKVRTTIVIQQLKDEGLLPNIEAPLVYNNTEIITSKKVALSQKNVQIKNPNRVGTIVYTTDGSDPRLEGGGISTKAKSMSSTVDIDASGILHLKARVKNGDEWSILRDIFCVPFGYDVQHLRLTEIHYHPQDTLMLKGKQLEFIEIKNTGKSSVDLMGISFENGISFTYEDHLMLAPGAFTVLASNAQTFESFYGLKPDGEYAHSLSNGGEELLINDALDRTLFRVAYSDESPWSTYADGRGYSLVSFDVNPAFDASPYYYWRSSFYLGGSPFADDVLHYDRTSESKMAKSELFVYPNPASNYVYVSRSEFMDDEVCLSFYAANGQQLLTSKVKLEPGLSTKISLQKFSLPSGVYLLTVESGSLKNTIKIIIDKK